MDRREFIRNGSAAVALSGGLGAVVASLVPPEISRASFWWLPLDLDSTRSWEEQGAVKYFDATSHGNVWWQDDDLIPVIRDQFREMKTFEMFDEEKQSVIKIMPGSAVFGCGWRGTEASRKAWETIACVDGPTDLGILKIGSASF